MHIQNRLWEIQIKINFNQSTPTTSLEHFRLETNIARNKAIPNSAVQIKYQLSTYTDGGKRWLVTTVDEEWSKGAGFMLRLKRRWDEQFHEKIRASKQNLRDNAARFKKELDMNFGSERAQTEIEADTTLNKTHKWSTETESKLTKD